MLRVLTDLSLSSWGFLTFSTQVLPATPVWKNRKEGTSLILIKNKTKKDTNKSSLNPEAPGQIWNCAILHGGKVLMRDSFLKQVKPNVQIK